MAASGGLTAERGSRLGGRGWCCRTCLGCQELISALFGELVDGVAVKAGGPEGAADVGGGVAAAAVGALGGAKVTVAFATRRTVYWVAAQGVIAPALATDDAISTTKAGVMPPLLTLRTHGDDVFVDPPQTSAKAAGRETNGGAHEGLTDGSRSVVLYGNGDDVSGS